MPNEPLPPPPTAKASDKALAVAAAFIGEFPGGSTVAGLLQQVFGEPFARRQEAWLRTLHSLFVELTNRGIDVDELADTPAFVTALHDATRVAAGEHLEAKLDLLKAVLFNTATRPSDPTADLWTLRYLAWVDELDPAHIVVLTFGNDPRGWLKAHVMQTPPIRGGTHLDVFGLAGMFDEDTRNLILDDLESRGLGSPRSTFVTGPAVYDPWITDRGRRFLDWLTIV